MKVLMIDDDYAIFKFAFADFPAKMFFAESEQQGMHMIAEQEFDAILMDGNLFSDRNGVDIVRTLRESGMKTRIIMFSSDEDLNAEGIAAGANGSWNKKLLYEDGWEKSLLETLK